MTVVSVAWLFCLLLWMLVQRESFRGVLGNYSVQVSTGLPTFLTNLAIIIPSKQITHVFLSALDLSGFVYIQMLNLYSCYMFRSTNRPSSGFSQYLLLENLHYSQRKIVCYI
jgi:hypothetical protein